MRFEIRQRDKIYSMLRDLQKLKIERDRVVLGDGFVESYAVDDRKFKSRYGLKAVAFEALRVGIEELMRRYTKEIMEHKQAGKSKKFKSEKKQEVDKLTKFILDLNNGLFWERVM